MGEALTIAAAGSIYPVALAAIVALLGGRDPLRRSLAFLVGGALASAAGFTIVIVCLNAGNLTPKHRPTAAAVLKIALGALLLLMALRTTRRGRDHNAASKPPAPSGSTRRALIAGMLVYVPGVFLVASARALADADLKPPTTILTSVACIVLLLGIAELPVLGFMIAPNRVQPALERVTAVGREHARRLVPMIEAVAGVYLLIAGCRAL